jgi:hypothetical protein
MGGGNAGIVDGLRLNAKSDERVNQDCVLCEMSILSPDDEARM